MAGYDYEELMGLSGANLKTIARKMMQTVSGTKSELSELLLDPIAVDSWVDVAQHDHIPGAAKGRRVFDVSRRQVARGAGHDAACAHRSWV